MLAPTRDQLIAQLQDSQKQLTAVLSSVAHDQDWKPHPGEWSFRFVAAHLAIGEKECLWERVKQFASGMHPHFEYYDNSSRDFSHLDLTDSLREWDKTRAGIFEFIRALPEEKLAATAQHATYGTITLLDYLRIWLEHDQEHLRDLETVVQIYRQGDESADM